MDYEVGTDMKEYAVGMKESVSKTISEGDVYAFAELTGDFNPAHVDLDWAANGVFGERVAHGIFVVGLISSVIGMKLPGPGTIYMEQDAKFKKPVYFGDTITAYVSIEEVLNYEKRVLRLKTEARNQKNEIVIDGYAIVKAPK